MSQPVPAGEVTVAALGTCTPVGLTARMTHVERAARTLRFMLTDVRDRAGEPVRAARLTLLEPWLSRTERIRALGATALEECLAASRSVHGEERLPIALVVPEEGLGAPWEEASLREALEKQAAPTQLEWIEGSWRGRAGFFPALQSAKQRLRGGRTPWVLVGGVDSLSDNHSLKLLVESERCLSSEQREGLMPGEGAGFILLGTSGVARSRGLEAVGWVLAEAQGQEARHFRQRAPNWAEGLTEAFRQLRRHPVAGSRRVDQVLSCQTGEGYWAKEFAQAYLRNAALFPEPLRVEEIAATLGDVGAAAGALQVGYGLHLLKKLGGGRALVYGSSDAGSVGACVLEVAS